MKYSTRLFIIVVYILTVAVSCDEDYDNKNGIHSNGNNEIRLYEDPPEYMEKQ